MLRASALEVVVDVVGNEIGVVKDFRVLNIYRDETSKEIAVELLIECSIGEVSAKIIVARNPLKALEKLYQHK